MSSGRERERDGGRRARREGGGRERFICMFAPVTPPPFSAG